MPELQDMIDAPKQQMTDERVSNQEILVQMRRELEDLTRRNNESLVVKRRSPLRTATRDRLSVTEWRIL